MNLGLGRGSSARYENISNLGFELAVAVIATKIWGAFLPPKPSRLYSSFTRPHSPSQTTTLTDPHSTAYTLQCILAPVSWFIPIPSVPAHLIFIPPCLRRSHPCCKSLNFSTFTTVQHYTTENRYAD